MYEKVEKLTLHCICSVFINILLEMIFSKICELPYVDVEFVHLFYKFLFYPTNVFLVGVALYDIVCLFREWKCH